MTHSQIPPDDTGAKPADGSAFHPDDTESRSRLDWFAEFEYAFISQLTHCPVVSFDIFDTALIRRHAHPYDVFMEVEARAESIGIQSAGFRHKRPQAEINARMKCGSPSGGHEDPGLDEIYGELTPHYSAADCIRLKQLELEVESDNLLANPEIYGLYSHALNQNRRIVFVSDMYFDEKTLAGWLSRSGYRHTDGIWVSADRGHSKREGNLYAEVPCALGVSPDAILHVGDNLQLDVENARTAGLRALHYLPPLKESSPGNSTAVSKQLGTWRHELLSRRITLPPPALIFDEVGYAYGAPLALAFVQWLAEELETAGDAEIVFCARDGWLLRQIYELIRSRSRPGLPESRYLLISRQALCLPAVSSLDDEMARFLLAGGKSSSVRELLERLGLTEPAVRLQELELDLDAGIESSEDAGKIWQFLHRHENLVMATAREQRSLCENYLRSMGLLRRNALVVVDLGWNASQQVALAEIFRLIHADCTVTGRYFGLYATAARLDFFGLGARAFMVGPDDSEEDQRNLQGAVPLIESLFTAPHGTVLDYVSGPDGAVAPRLAPASFESGQWPLVSIFQNAVLRGIRDLLRQERMQVDRKDAKCAFEALALKPSFDVAEACGELRHSDGVHSESEGSVLADISSLTGSSPDYLRETFARAGWKWGWLARLSGRMETLPDSAKGAAADLIHSQNIVNTSPWDSAIEIMLNLAVDDGVTGAFVYGAGDFGVRIARLARSRGIKIIAFIDSSKAMRGRRVEGLAVLSLEEAMGTGPHAYFTGSYAWAKHITGIIRRQYADQNLNPRVYSFDSF
jgi:hypothetical protein